MSTNWEELFESKIATVASSEDPAHDLNHFKRVVMIAKKLCIQESAKIHPCAVRLHDGGVQKS
ncbi:MAG: hypothetical protein V4654_15055 [Bdellovibrionota bacterium]